MRRNDDFHLFRGQCELYRSYNSKTTLKLKVSMPRINDQTYPQNSLIELCVYPDVNVNLIICELKEQEHNSIIIENNLNISLLEAEAFYIPHYKDFIIKLTELKQFENFWLFIDSITHYVDQARMENDNLVIHNCYNTLWGLIYDCGATIIVTNHLRNSRFGQRYSKLPRLGQRWERMISFRIFISRNGKELSYKTTRNTEMEF